MYEMFAWRKFLEQRHLNMQVSDKYKKVKVVVDLDMQGMYQRLQNVMVFSEWSWALQNYYNHRCEAKSAYCSSQILSSPSLCPSSSVSRRQLSGSNCCCCPTFFVKCSLLSINPFRILVGDERKKSSSQSSRPSQSDDDDEFDDSVNLEVESPSPDGDADDNKSRLLDDKKTLGM